MRGFTSGVRLQLAFYRNVPDMLIPLVTGPLFTTIFTMVLRHGGRQDLTGYAVIAPFYMSLWWFALFNGGWVIQMERWAGTIDYLLAAPVSFASVVIGRISTTMIAGSVSLIEVWAFGRYVLGATITIHHPGVFAASLVLTLVAMTTTSLLMANLFILGRDAATFSNSASYPIYLLGGILVPVALLPGWLQPITNVVFLSWSSRLLRGSLASAPIPNTAFDFMMLALLTVFAGALAGVIVTRLVNRARQTGELALR
jgi:ABC-2 type transport system permease protein